MCVAYENLSQISKYTSYHVCILSTDEELLQSACCHHQQNRKHVDVFHHVEEMLETGLIGKCGTRLIARQAFLL